jgi:hypothetical protein
MCTKCLSFFQGKSPVVLRQHLWHSESGMNIRIVLHVFGGDHLLFFGPSADCPPIPRSGDEIVHEQHRVRLEGICYQYRPNELEIALLA